MQYIHRDKERVLQAKNELTELLVNKALPVEARSLISNFSRKISEKTNEGFRFILHKWLQEYKMIRSSINIEPKRAKILKKRVEACLNKGAEAAILSTADQLSSIKLDLKASQTLKFIEKSVRLVQETQVGVTTKSDD